MNKKQESKDIPKNQRIQVFARCRPLNALEKKQFSPTIVDVIPEKKEILLRDKNANREFYFDKVFSPDSSQVAVYKAVVAPLIKEVMAGYNCTVFAYGQTGTGKTYTMEGERCGRNVSWEDDPGAGIIPRSLHQLFEELNKEENVEFSVRVSFLELYNEELFDLLSSNELSRLRLFEDSTKKGSVVIQGLEEIIVNSKDEVYAILEKGTARRQTAATLLNASSSRSHTVFSVTVHIKENMVNGEELLKTGKLNLVDLAGSENVGRSGAVDKRAREAGNINQSLLTLGRVITSLIEKTPHIPYRESKLTRLLQDSLGGHTKTSIIATISPAHCNFDETVSTLDYATKAKSITIKPVVNQKMTKRALIKEYTDEIERLRKDLAAARSNSGYFIDNENYNSMLREIEFKSDRIQELTDKVNELIAENAKVEDHLSVLKKEFHKKEMELYDLKEILKKTTLDRDEKEFLIEVQRKIEKKLSDQAETLLQVVNQSTKDVSGLHEKIDRKVITEKVNEEQIQNFKYMFQRQLARMLDQVFERKDKQIAGLESMEEDLKNCISCIATNHMKHSKCLKDLSSYFNTRLNNVSTELQTEAHNNMQWSEKLCEDIECKYSSVTAEHQQFLNNDIPDLFQQIKSANSLMTNIVMDVCNCLCQKIDVQRDTLTQQITNEKAQLKSMSDALRLFNEHQHNIREDIKATEEKQQFLQSQQEKDFGDTITLLQGLFKRHQEIKSNATILNSFDSMLEEKITLCTKSLDEKLVLSSVIVDEHYARNNEHLGDLCITIDKEKLSEAALCVEKNQNNMKSGFEQHLIKTLEVENKNLNHTKAGLKKYISCIDDAKDKNMNDFSSINEGVDIKLEESESICQEQCESLQSHLGLVLNECEAAKQQIEKFTSEFKGEIIHRDVEVEKLVSEDLVKDIPTGNTPQRQSYSYPKTLVEISSHNQILQRYRSQLARDTANAINLPLNSSFESIESKESEGSPCSDEVFNASFTSEDCTGFETDSSVASESIDMNKENQVHITKPSRIAKRRKPKGFLKPPAPSTIKPLLSSNILK